MEFNKLIKYWNQEIPNINENRLAEIFLFDAN